MANELTCPFREHVQDLNDSSNATDKQLLLLDNKCKKESIVLCSQKNLNFPKTMTSRSKLIHTESNIITTNLLHITLYLLAPLFFLSNNIWFNQHKISISKYIKLYVLHLITKMRAVITTIKMAQRRTMLMSASQMEKKL